MFVFREDSGYMGEPELIIYGQLNSYLSWWKRAYVAIRYVLGIEPKNYAWAEVVANHEKIIELSEFISKLAERSKDDNARSISARLEKMREQSERLSAYSILQESLTAWTKTLKNHPDGYVGPCECEQCIAQPKREE